MFVVSGALIGAAALAAYAYLRRERLGRAGWGLAALRWATIAGLVLLAMNPPWPGAGQARPPLVLLDRSLSFGVRGGRWTEARDSAAALAGADGRVLGFGATTGPVTDSEPGDGTTRLRDALATARAVGGPVVVVTDGEVADAAALPPGALDGVRLVVLRRDSAPGAAATGFRVPPLVHLGDTVPMVATIATWGGLPADSARLEVEFDGRRAVVQTVALPTSPATLQRTLAVPTAGLRPGDHVVALRIAVDGDPESQDDVRMRVITLAAAAPLVVIANPASWEGRFLFETFRAVAGVPTRGFARIGREAWLDLATSRGVTPDEVRRAAAQSALLVIHSPAEIVLGGTRTPLWHWRAAGVGEAVVPGDWYVDREPAPSPLQRALARVEWDSVPPLTGVPPSPTDTGEVVLSARRGRRGQSRAVVVSGVEDGRRVLRTLATGFYRWALRGGASREAMRALVAGGTDWLLASSGPDARALLVADRDVPRGTPVSFRWSGGGAPDSLQITVTSGTEQRAAVLHFDAAGGADVRLPVGAHAWAAPTLGTSGTVAVEPYSAEFPPAPVTVAAATPPVGSSSGVPSRVRDRWWVYALVLLLLVGEWAWRQRRGLP